MPLPTRTLLAQAGRRWYDYRADYKWHDFTNPKYTPFMYGVLNWVVTPGAYALAGFQVYQFMTGEPGR